MDRFLQSLSVFTTAAFLLVIPAAILGKRTLRLLMHTGLALSGLLLVLGIAWQDTFTIVLQGAGVSFWALSLYLNHRSTRRAARQ